MDEKHEPHFNGANYIPGRDWARLTTQIGRVFKCMERGDWRTLREISDITGDPEASVSAQLRHLRKERFGLHTVNRKYIRSGLYKYQVQVTPSQKELFQ